MECCYIDLHLFLDVYLRAAPADGVVMMMNAYVLRVAWLRVATSSSIGMIMETAAVDVSHMDAHHQVLLMLLLLMVWRGI